MIRTRETAATWARAAVDATRTAAGDPHVRVWAPRIFGAIGVVCAIDAVNTIAIDEPVLGFDAEGSALTIASAAAFGLAGLGSFAAAQRPRLLRPPWVAIGALGLLFATEESNLKLHERFEEATSLAAGLVLAVLVGLALVAVLWRSVSRIPTPVPVLLGAAGITLIGAQLAAGLANLAGRVSAPAQEVLAFVEECGEVAVAGWVLLAVAAFLAARPPREPEDSE